MWEFKQIKDLYLRIVTPRNLFIEFTRAFCEARSNPLEVTNSANSAVYVSPKQDKNTEAA